MSGAGPRRGAGLGAAPRRCPGRRPGLLWRTLMVRALRREGRNSEHLQPCRDKEPEGSRVASIPSGTDDDGFSDCHECARSHIAGVYPLGPRYVTSTNCAGLLARWVTWAAVVMERVSGVVLPVIYILCCRCGVPRDGGVPRGGVLFRASRVFVVVPRVTWLLCALRHVGPRRASK